MEIGAAIHLPPNVNGILRRFGIDPGLLGANDTEWVGLTPALGPRPG
jgi:salicylate hydroxylase